MHKYGLKILVIIFAFVIGYFAVMFRIIQISNKYYDLEDKNNYPTKFYDLSHCFWLVIVSMSTSRQKIINNIIKYFTFHLIFRLIISWIW
jgi:hypothetical protein